jgi:4'-phosphopantetheinyl transferase
MSLRTLTASDLEVWLTRLVLVQEPALLAQYTELLSPPERERLARIVHDETRHQYLVSRALVRTTLSRYAPVAPQSWEFAFNEYGRPELAGGQTDVDLRFNLSHTHGLVACAVALGRNVGIDVEWTLREPSLLDSAHQFFSPAEVDDLMSVPPSNRNERFFQCWTLKEAYMKAHGKGLSMPLSEFSIRIARDPSSTIRLEPAPGDDAEGWQLWVWNPTREHTLGLAAAFPRSGTVTLRVESVIPLPQGA